MIMEVRYNPALVLLSILVAIFASLVALEMANSVTQAKGRAQAMWLSCGALAMGFGIWSMHFVGMLAFEMPGMSMAYDIPLAILSVVIAIVASALALFIVSRPVVPAASIVAGGVAMAAAISGMHYTGMYSMRMDAVIKWNPYLVALSVLIALVASFIALFVAIRMRKKFQYWQQGLASVILGFAISGMHYTGMVAATFLHADVADARDPGLLLATSELTLAVLGTTALILGLALASSTIDRAFTRRTRKAEESVRLYQNANKAIVELEHERELRDRFVSALAHDLRIPLTAAKISAQLAIRRSTTPGELERLSGKVVESLDRADHMIQNLLDAHRIAAGKPLPLEIEPCELGPFLQKILEDLATVHGDRFILLCEDGLKGKWDTKYLRRAIENLCTNAVKYGREGTPVVVRANCSGVKVTISVQNQGPALSQEEQESLFQLFHRGSQAQSTGQRGWGLGLTIIRGVAQAHGGIVRVESSVERGTEFFLELPQEAQESPSQA